MDYSPPGSSVHGIFQARVLEWVAIPSSSSSSPLRDQTRVSRITGRFFSIWATREARVQIEPLNFCKVHFLPPHRFRLPWPLMVLTSPHRFSLSCFQLVSTTGLNGVRCPLLAVLPSSRAWWQLTFFAWGHCRFLTSLQFDCTCDRCHPIQTAAVGGTEGKGCLYGNEYAPTQAGSPKRCGWTIFWRKVSSPDPWERLVLGDTLNFPHFELSPPTIGSFIPLGGCVFR